MSVQRILAAGRSLALKNVSSPNREVMALAKRNYLVSSPPRDKMSLGEKILISVIFTTSVTFIPAWVVYHIREYGGATK